LVNARRIRGGEHRLIGGFGANREIFSAMELRRVRRLAADIDVTAERFGAMLERRAVRRTTPRDGRQAPTARAPARISGSTGADDCQRTAGFQKKLTRDRSFSDAAQ